MALFPSSLGERTFPAATRSFLFDLVTPVVRVGVTGLARSGKTVFITALVKCLCDQGALPPFTKLKSINGFRGYLEPQPDDDVPRFAYEAHLDQLTAEIPCWPESTRQISQLRLTFEWDAPDIKDRLMRFDVSQRLHVDIIDYPGEWLTDLGLLDKSFEGWSRDVLGVVRSPALDDVSSPFLLFLDELDGASTIDEDKAIDGAQIYTQFLNDARTQSRAGNVLGPGRFLMPGDLAGTPQLTFFPYAGSDGAPDGPSFALLERRFESYKANLVRPFFEKHFTRLDRQIVLVDALSALNGGAAALTELEHGLENVLRAFRPGRNTWLSRLLTRRIDRIVFAASKADHVHATSRKRLQMILEKCVSRASARCQDAGAEIECLALSALRATNDVETKVEGDTFKCVRGVLDLGEVVSGKSFDGKTSAVVFPGDLPADPLDAFDADLSKSVHFNFARFRPPVISQGKEIAITRPWPHINLDKAFSFLLGDFLP